MHGADTSAGSERPAPAGADAIPLARARRRGHHRDARLGARRRAAPRLRSRTGRRRGRRGGAGRHGLDRLGDQSGEFLQQLALHPQLVDHRAGVRALQAHHAAAAHLPLGVEQAPLRLQHRRLLGAGVEAVDVQQHLHLGFEADPVRVEGQPAAVQPRGQLAQQQAGDVVFQATGPTRLAAHAQVAVELALHHRLALEVVGHLQRAEQHGDAAIVLGQRRVALLQPVEVRRRAGDAAAQGQQPGERDSREKGAQARKTHGHFTVSCQR